MSENSDISWASTFKLFAWGLYISHGIADQEAELLSKDVWETAGLHTVANKKTMTQIFAIIASSAEFYLRNDRDLEKTSEFVRDSTVRASLIPQDTAPVGPRKIPMHLQTRQIV